MVAATFMAGCSAGGGTLRAGSVETAPAPVTTPAADAPAGALDPAQKDAGGAVVAPPRPRNAGAVSLQAQAASERTAGDYERSAATLERAIRIAPDAAEIQPQRGGVRRNPDGTPQGRGRARVLPGSPRCRRRSRADLAEGMARRAAALAGGDAPLRREAEALAERARRAR